MSRELLEHLPSFRARDLVYIDPSDEERVVTINSVACVPRNRIPFVVSSVVGAFKGVYGDSWAIAWSASFPTSSLRLWKRQTPA